MLNSQPVSEKRPISVVHITSGRRLTSGQRSQLLFEVEASNDLLDASWKTIAVHTEEPQESFEQRIPYIFRGIFLRNLFTWFLVLRQSRKHDFVLLRHITFDPFAFIFAPIIKNRISVHHAKEVEELRLIAPGVRGKLASLLELCSGRLSVSTAVAVLGVTEDIAEYQQSRVSGSLVLGVFPNGISSKSINAVKDARDNQAVNAAFICGTFNSWHGLDRLVDAVNAAKEDDCNDLKILLIGKLDSQQRQLVRSTANAKQVFEEVGTLCRDEYTRLLAKCDIGIGSLAMDRQRLRQGATLKVRELLTMGIPVYATHKDVCLPDSFPFFLNDNKVDLRNLRSFGRVSKSFGRDEVRSRSLEFIEKRAILERTIERIAAISH